MFDMAERHMFGLLDGEISVWFQDQSGRIWRLEEKYMRWGVLIASIKLDVPLLL